MVIDSASNSKLSFIGCGLRTVERRLQEWGIRRRERTISDEQLEQLILEIKASSGPFQGERAIFAKLQASGHWAPRQAVRELIRRIDPIGVDARYVPDCTH